MEFPELRALEAAVGAGRLNLETIFQNRAGLGAKKLNQRRLKTLLAAAPLLTQLLWNGETVDFAARAVYSSILENLNGGIWVQFLNQTLVLLTNYRLIFINVETKNSPKPMH